MRTPEIACSPADADFYRRPILNSPYMEPDRHWELDESGQPTQKIRPWHRPADFITPVPKPKKTRKAQIQGQLVADATQAKADAISNSDVEYHKALINEIRSHLRQWRGLPKSEWKVTPVTARLLEHWRNLEVGDFRPFFCQIEAVETAIWLMEVAPRSKKTRERYLDWLKNAEADHNPGLSRLALKMATGSGKITVMAMLIAWQTLNAVRCPAAAKFTKGFLIVTPGITIRDRLQVLRPNNPDSYYQKYGLVPADMLRDLGQVRIVITNFHAFMPREKYDVSSGTRSVLEGWRERPLETRESEGEMLKRTLPELAGLKNIVVINDEAHHCYREKAGSGEDEFKSLKGVDKTDAKNEAKDRQEAARVWISGLQAVQRQIGINRVFDLSATPAFLAGSGYIEGTIFPWVLSDFSLMDAIECGIVKLPRIPVADNISSLEVPMYRNLWEHIRDRMPRNKAGALQRPELPSQLITALESLYTQYRQTFENWRQARISVPPCFIVVCNNTTTSKLVFDYIAGYEQTLTNGETVPRPAHCPMFSNYGEDGSQLARPRTLLIDSAQLERGDILDAGFRKAASAEIERFRREAILRGGQLAAWARAGKELPDAAILREVMNTVGKKGQLGESVRCAVSVGMLSEGWDANNVTHILGVRAFGSQLLCEQVIGRALRRQNYNDFNSDGLLVLQS